MTEDFNPEIKQGLSDYSRKLAADARESLKSYSFAPKDDNAELNELEYSFEDINKNFINICLVSILADMSLEERETIKERPLEVVDIIRLAAGKINLSEEDKKSIENALKKITPEVARLPSKLLKELGLMNDESLFSGLESALYDLLQKKPEAAEAYSYLNFTA